MSDFADSNGDLSYDAMAEQLALIMPLYWRDRDKWDEALSFSQQAVTKDIFFLRSETATPNDDDVTPSMGAFRTADGRAWVHLAGTETGHMWAGNLGGALWRKEFFDTPVTAHGYFYGVMETQTERWLDHYGEDYKPAKMLVSGHSLGGGSAYLIACWFKKRWPDVEVQCLTYGAPRSMGAGYQGPSPDYHFRVINDIDAVTFLPPGTSELENYFYFDLFKVLFRNLSWSHYGKEYWFSRDGVLESGSSFDLDNVVKVTRVDEQLAHFTPAYLRMISAYYRRTGFNEKSAAMLAVAATMVAENPEGQDKYGLPDPSKFTDLNALNAAAGLPAGTIKRTNFADFDSIQSDAGPARAAAPLMDTLDAFELTANNPFFAVLAGGAGVATFKVTFEIQLGDEGWRESYYLLGQSGDPNASATAITALANARSGLFAALPTVATEVDNYAGAWISSVRVQNVALPGPGALRRTPKGTFKHSASTAVTADMWNAYTVQLADVTGRSRRYLQIAGMPDTWIPVSHNGRDQSLLTQEGKDALAAFLQVLAPQNGVSNWGLRVLTAAGVGDRKILGVTVDAVTDAFKLRFEGDYFPDGSKVIVRGVRGTGLQGINGKAKVIARETNGTIVTINKYQCLDCTIKLKSNGVMRLEADSTYPVISSGIGIGASKKNPSVPTSGRRSRPRKGCCR